MSTDIEKLRALLAEARGRFGLFIDEELRARIDSALAEPVQPVKPPRTTWARFAYDFRERAEKAERERNEARAEVERLKEDREAVFFRGEDDGYQRGRRNGFQRGAEAMREAAATAVLTRFHLSSVMLAQSIRALPIPENK